MKKLFDKLDDKKMRKYMKFATIVLLVILVVESIYFIYRYYNYRKNSTFYSITSDIVLLDKGYVGVGFSDFKHSKFNDRSDYTKATIWKYNEDYEATKEEYLSLGYNSYFNSIIEVEDGYVAVGAIEMTEEQNEESLTEGLIVRFDKDFNVVWRKNIQVLDDTDLVRVKLDSDNNLIIVGQSIYAANYIGNHSSGGAILLKFNLDGKELFRFNYGGPKTGMFNDVYIESDGYVVVGSYSATGIIKKYDFEGNEVWHNYYGPTDGNGITNIEKVDDYYLVTTTLTPSKDDKSSYKAVLVKYSSNGEKVDEVVYDKNTFNVYNDLYVDDEYIYVVGNTGIVKDEDSLLDAFLVKYDMEFNVELEKNMEEENSDSYTKIYKSDDDILVIGFTNSKLKEYKTNGYDYYSILVKY